MTLPSALEAEAEILGAALALPEAWPELAHLQPADLWDPFHRRAFEAMQALAASGTPLDALTVADGMRRLGEESTDLAVRLMGLASAAVGTNLRHHVGLVQRSAGLRQLAIWGERWAKRALEGSVAPDELAADIRRELAALDTVAGAGPERLGDRLDAVYDVICERAAHPERHLLLTGIEPFDLLIGGLQGGRLTVTAARPGAGKTSLAACICTNVARAGSPVLFFSLEETTQQVAERVLGMVSNTTVHKIGKGQLGYDEYLNLKSYRGDIGVLPFWIDSQTTRIGQIVAESRRWRAAQTAGLGVIAIDYLSLVQAPEAERRDLQVGQVVKECKRLAKDTGYVVILIAQLNRRMEQEQRKPVLSDLRESGEIEQDSDVILIPHRDRPVCEAGPVQLLVLKNRGSITGEVTCEWHPETMRYT